MLKLVHQYQLLSSPAFQAYLQNFGPFIKVQGLVQYLGPVKALIHGLTFISSFRLITVLSIGSLC